MRDGRYTSREGRWVAISSAAVAGAWTTADHQQIVWCNQLVSTAHHLHIVPIWVYYHHHQQQQQ
jgi:hypothetical protein